MQYEHGVQCGVRGGAQRGLAHLIAVAHLRRYARMAAPRRTRAAASTRKSTGHVSPLSRLLSRRPTPYQRPSPSSPVMCCGLPEGTGADVGRSTCGPSTPTRLGDEGERSGSSVSLQGLQGQYRRGRAQTDIYVLSAVTSGEVSGSSAASTPQPLTRVGHLVCITHFYNLKSKV